MSSSASYLQTLELLCQFPSLAVDDDEAPNDKNSEYAVPDLPSITSIRASCKEQNGTVAKVYRAARLRRNDHNLKRPREEREGARGGARGADEAKVENMEDAEDVGINVMGCSGGETAAADEETERRRKARKAEKRKRERERRVNEGKDGEGQTGHRRLEQQQQQQQQHHRRKGGSRVPPSAEKHKGGYSAAGPSNSLPEKMISPGDCFQPAKLHVPHTGRDPFQHSLGPDRNQHHLAGEIAQSSAYQNCESQYPNPHENSHHLFSQPLVYYGQSPDPHSYTRQPTHYFNPLLPHPEYMGHQQHPPPPPDIE